MNWNAPAPTGGAATGGAATGGAGTGEIMLMGRLTGFEGDAQTKLVRTLFGPSVDGLTAREIYETTSPTSQCKHVIGEPETCWICGFSLTDTDFVRALGLPQCEHILPIVQAIMYLGLYSHSYYKTLDKTEKENYLEYLKMEYGWAHAECNYQKKAAVYIKYHEGRYVIDVGEIYNLLQKILKLPSFISINPLSRKTFIEIQMKSIINRIFAPIVNDFNNRWLGINGKTVVARGLDQLSAIVSLLTAPKTAVGEAATAGANLGGHVKEPLTLPNDVSVLYRAIQRRRDVSDRIKSILSSDEEIRDTIFTLYSKIPFVAPSKSSLNTYIEEVGNYAIFLAFNKPSSSSRGSASIRLTGVTIPTYSKTIIDELQNFKLIDTVSAIVGAAPPVPGDAITDSNPVHDIVESLPNLNISSSNINNVAIDSNSNTSSNSGGIFTVEGSINSITGEPKHNYFKIIEDYNRAVEETARKIEARMKRIEEMKLREKEARKKALRALYPFPVPNINKRRPSINTVGGMRKLHRRTRKTAGSLRDSRQTRRRSR